MQFLSFEFLSKAKCKLSLKYQNNVPKPTLFNAKQVLKELQYLACIYMHWVTHYPKIPEIAVRVPVSTR